MLFKISTKVNQKYTRTHTYAVNRYAVNKHNLNSVLCNVLEGRIIISFVNKAFYTQTHTHAHTHMQLID